MKKPIVIIIAVAILGLGGMLAKNHQNSENQTTFQGYKTNPQATPTSSSSVQSASTTNSGNSSSSSYKDGTYTGAAEDTPYGTVQVAAVISGGKITDIKFLQMPGPEGHSKEVTAFAMSPLKQSAIAKQSARIDFVSGASSTSEGYELSLQAALDQAA